MTNIMKKFDVNLVAGVLFILLGMKVVLTRSFFTWDVHHIGASAVFIGSFFLLMGSMFIYFWRRSLRR